MLSVLEISYRADIWLNGHKIADADSVVGGFRQYSIDISRYVVFGGKNALAAKVYRPDAGAVTLGFVDWNPKPADHDMRIRDISDYMTARGFRGFRLNGQTMLIRQTIGTRTALMAVRLGSIPRPARDRKFQGSDR